MSNTFSLQRFVWLFNKHTKEHFKNYLMSLVVLAGILALVLSYVMYMESLTAETQLAIFCMLLLGIGFIFTSSIFAELGSRQKSVSALVLPVARLERFLVAWIYSFVIFQIVFIACFLVINSIVVNLSPVQSADYQATAIFGKGKLTYFSVLPYYCFVHSFSFLDAMVFKKGHFIKTAFIFFLFLLMLMYLNGVLAGFIFNSNEIISKMPFSKIAIYEANGQQYHLGLDRWFSPILTTIIMGSAVFLWMASYFKLKEKQV